MKTTARQRKLNIRYNDSIITETVGHRDGENWQSLNPDQFKLEMKWMYMIVIDSAISEMRRRFLNNANKTYIESLQLCNSTVWSDYHNDEVLTPIEIPWKTS